MPEPKSPYKRVRRAFDREGLKRVCEMHESQFADAYDLSTTMVDQRDADRYFYKDNGADILFVAHLDTVVDHEQRRCGFLDTAGGPVVYSGALDDRLGAYIGLELLPSLGITYDILLTIGEESGRSTAQFFDTDKAYNWMIEFDRGGSDVVMYQYEDDETIDLVYASGAKPDTGIFSDIAYLEHLEIKGFNWGVGYKDYHSVRSHAYLEDTYAMVGHYLNFHEQNAETYLPHEMDERDSWWGGGFRRDGVASWDNDVWADDIDDEFAAANDLRQYALDTPKVTDKLGDALWFIDGGGVAEKRQA